MGCVHALHRRRAAPDQQQLGRQPDPADRARAFELAVRWGATRGPTCRSGDELDAVDQAHGLDPHAYLKDPLQRLPMHKARLVAGLLPHAKGRTR